MDRIHSLSLSLRSTVHRVHEVAQTSSPPFNFSLGGILAGGELLVLTLKRLGGDPRGSTAILLYYLYFQPYH